MSSFVETEANFLLDDNSITNFVVSWDNVEVNFDIGDNSTTTIDASGATNDATHGSDQGDDRNAFRLGSGQETITGGSGADLFEVGDSTDLTASDSFDPDAGDFDAQELDLNSGTTFDLRGQDLQNIEILEFDPRNVTLLVDQANLDQLLAMVQKLSPAAQASRRGRPTRDEHVNTRYKEEAPNGGRGASSGSFGGNQVMGREDPSPWPK
ncbi:MAG: hypothetical protein PVH83_08910 [Methyloceanibacter sp.]|jgi:hypothetical protein